MGTEEYLLDKARTEGMEKGLKQGKEQFVKYLILRLGFDDKQTAAAAEVSIEFVQHIRRCFTEVRQG